MRPKINVQTDSQTKDSPATLRCGDGFGWIDSQRAQGFATWADEIAHMETIGYKLVPPDYHIPHWSRADGARKLYVNGRDGPREMTACFDRPARDLGYPIFFKPNAEISHDRERRTDA